MIHLISTLCSINNCLYIEYQTYKITKLFYKEHILSKQRIKSNQISAILIQDCRMEHITGLIGLLATFNLGGRQKSIQIYGTKKLRIFLFNLLKYSQTNFSFPIYFIDLEKYIIHSNLILSLCLIPTGLKSDEHFHKILEKQQTGRFQINKAQEYGIRPSFIYQELKEKKVFLTLDGITINGKYFSGSPKLGKKYLFTGLKMHQRNYIESFWSSNYCSINVIRTIPSYMLNNYYANNGHILGKICSNYKKISFHINYSDQY